MASNIGTLEKTVQVIYERKNKTKAEILIREHPRRKYVPIYR